MSKILVVKNGCADLIHPWVIDCTQLESARSVVNYAIAVLVAELQHFKILALLCMYINNSP